jgi:hypothetical protein
MEGIHNIAMVNLHAGIPVRAVDSQTITNIKLQDIVQHNIITIQPVQFNLVPK